MNAPWTPPVVVEPAYGPADMRSFAAAQMEVALMLGHVRPTNVHTTCSECVFFYCSAGERLGECHHYAPRADRDGYAAHPRINPDSGCGEGEPA